MAEEILTYCGLNCKECGYREEFQCQGCIASQGHPFYGECELAQCAIKKGRRFCGECPDFACELLIRYSYDEKEGDKGARIEHCRELKSALVAEARDGKDPIGYCGHHCDHCFMGKWCGGCRSDYDCCSYATLFDDKKCQNRECCRQKGLDGCYACDELEACEKGYYSIYGEYVAKASAMFIKKYGKQLYTKTLIKAMNDGINYPKSFDKTGSVRGALRLFEKYRTQDDLW